jgi:RecA-family ATPase
MSSAVQLLNRIGALISKGELMNLDDLKEFSVPKTGNRLRTDLDTMVVKDEYMAEGFLYERKIHMIYADPAAGKSTVAQQVAIELSAGRPLFGSLVVARPFRVYYIQLEGDYEESINRGQLMEKSGPINCENLCWDDTLVGLNVLNKESVDKLIENIRLYMPEPDLIIIDPIYQAIVGDLSKPEIAAAYCHFSSYLRHYFKCALLHIHHTPKESFDQTGAKIERQTFFGSQWFAAHMNAMYYLKTVDKKRGKTALYNKKQRNGNMLREIDLTFDLESHTVYIEREPSNMTGRERVLDYLKQCKRAGNKPSIYEIMEGCQLTCTWARNLTVNLVKNGLVEVTKSNKGLKLYEILGQF